MTSGSSGLYVLEAICRLSAFLVGALEVAQALRAGLADAGVLVFLLDDVGAALGLDPGQSQSLAEDRRQVVQGQLDLEDVVPRRLAGPPGPASPSPERPIGVPTSPGPWPTPPRFLVP